MQIDAGEAREHVRAIYDGLSMINWICQMEQRDCPARAAMRQALHDVLMTTGKLNVMLGWEYGAGRYRDG